MQVIDKTWLATVGRSCFFERVSQEKRGSLGDLGGGFYIIGNVGKIRVYYFTRELYPFID